MQPMFLPVHKHQPPPNNRKDQPPVPSRLREGVAVRLQDLSVRLGADDEHGVAVEERVVPDEVGTGPLADPGRVGLDGGARGELAEGLAEEEVVVLRVSEALASWVRGPRGRCKG